MEEKQITPAAPDRSSSVFHPTSVVFERRKNIIRFTLLFACVLTAGSFLIANKYAATAVILPDVDVLSAAQKLGSLQDIASSVGLNLGVTSPSQLYPDILVSETILIPVIRRQYGGGDLRAPEDLIRFWGFSADDSLLSLERCLRRLREHVLSVDVNKKTGILALTVETSNPYLSSDVANEMVYQLDRYQRNFRRTNASEQRKFLDQRLGEVDGDLKNAEEHLKNFREKNRRVLDSPQLLLEQDRMEREVMLNSTLFVELKKQYELVKLDEIKNTPVVQVLDPARPPAEKTSPKRSVIFVLSALLAAVLSSAYWILSEYVRSYPRRESVQRLSEIMAGLKRDFAYLRKLLSPGARMRDRS